MENGEQPPQLLIVSTTTTATTTTTPPTNTTLLLLLLLLEARSPEPLAMTLVQIPPETIAETGRSPPAAPPPCTPLLSDSVCSPRGRTSNLLIVHPPIPAPRPSSAPARPLAGGGRASSPALRPPPSPASAGAPSRAPSAQSAEPEAGRQQPSGGGRSSQLLADIEPGAPRVHPPSGSCSSLMRGQGRRGGGALNGD